MMLKTIKSIFILAIFMITPVIVSASEKKESSNNGAVDTQSEVNAYIEHHLKDSHDFNLWSDGEAGTHVGFPLPVIFWSKNGLTTFMSSKFHHTDDGSVIVEANNSKFTKIHGRIYELNEGASHVEFDDHHHATNAHKITFDLSITKNVFGMLLVSLLMFLMFRILAKSYKKSAVPEKGISRLLEPLVIYVRDDIAKPNIGEKKYRKYMGFLLTVFFFIWILNLLGMTPLGFNVTGNIAVTVCLALFTFFIVQFSGNKEYWKHIFWMPDVPVLMKIALIPIEVLGILTKPFSLLIRLFANITAGHTVVMGLLAIVVVGKAQLGVVGATGVSVILTLFISVIEILVAFLQAFIFTMLSSLFIGMAVQDHDHH